MGEEDIAGFVVVQLSFYDVIFASKINRSRKYPKEITPIWFLEKIPEYQKPRLPSEIPTEVYFFKEHGFIVVTLDKLNYIDVSF